MRAKIRVYLPLASKSAHAATASPLSLRSTAAHHACGSGLAVLISCFADHRLPFQNEAYKAPP
jgi:hypothetical protein